MDRWAILIVVGLVVALFPTGTRAKRDRYERAIAQLNCRVRLDEALLEADKLRGSEREAARRGAHRAYRECRRQRRMPSVFDDLHLERPRFADTDPVPVRR